MYEFISEQIRKQKGTFESDWGNQISEFGVYGKTVHTFVYAADTKKRYVHIYYNAGKAAGERSRLEANIQEMQNHSFPDLKIQTMNSDHHFINIFICIITKIPTTSCMESLILW